MSNSVFSRRTIAAHSASGSSIIETLESRRLMSASPIHVSTVTPGKILAPNTGHVKVTIQNTTAVAETETATITLAPSLNGHTASGAYTSAPVTETLTIKAHGSATVTVPFTPPVTLAQGKYHTLATVNLGGTVYTATAPGTYTLTIPPIATTTPSLIGHYTGQARGAEGTGSGGTVTHAFGFIWQTTSQTTTGLTGTFTIGDQSFTGTMTGSEFNTGAVDFTLTSPDINYTIKGTVSADGSTITGKITGLLVNNLFKHVFGHFQLSRQAS
jgi:hypothetical protein